MNPIWERDRISPALILWVVVLSLLFHAVIIIGLKKIPVVSPGVVVIEPPQRSVHLEFVDSPDRIEPVKEEPVTDLISDRSSRAQDVVPDHAEESESPRSVGTAKSKSIRKVPAGRSAAIEAPAAPEGQAALREKPAGETSEGEAGRRESEQSGARISGRPGKESPIQSQGEDAFYSPEEDSPDGRAMILKQIAYNTRSTEVGKYLARLKPRIVNLWHFNIMNNTFYVRSAGTHVLFKIMQDGTLGKVMVNKHDGPDVEMRYSLTAIEQAQPYEPLNEEIMEYIQDDGLWLEFHFLYH
ncbi:MAG: hypothetical protein V1789_06830 [PVC group bacterium]